MPVNPYAPTTNPYATGRPTPPGITPSRPVPPPVVASPFGQDTFRPSPRPVPPPVVAVGPTPVAPTY